MPQPFDAGVELIERAKRNADLMDQFFFTVLPIAKGAFVVEDRIRKSTHCVSVIGGHLVVHRATPQVARAPPMVRQLDARCRSIGSSFEFFRDPLMKRPHAFREQLAVENLLRQGMAKRKVLRAARLVLDQLKRTCVLQCAQDRLTLSLAKSYQTVDGKAFAQHGSKGEYRALLLRKQTRPREDCASNRERQLARSCSGIAREFALEQLFCKKGIALAAPHDAGDCCTAQAFSMRKRLIDQHADGGFV